jgi:D-glycero-alpha-D-manno-heptose-7-phosphate kinase
MIICRTPFRVSFFGGGTDMPIWTEMHDGHVISSAINKFGYIFLRHINLSKKDQYKIRYYLNEETKNYNKIKHPVIKSAIKKYKLTKKKLHITYDGDLPSRSGLGSSSSFTVGLINIFKKFNNEKINKKRLAIESINFEHKILKESVGYQDQIAAVYGGLNYIKFKKKKFMINSLNKFKSQKTLNESIMLFLVEGKRNASSLESIKNKKIIQNYQIYKDIYNITNEALKLIKYNNNYFLNDFGRLLNEYWLLKKSLDKLVSNDEIDYYIRKFKELGANGSKLMGAGSSGFILIIASPETQNKIIKKFTKKTFIKINLENEGSKIIYSDI